MWLTDGSTNKKFFLQVMCKLNTLPVSTNPSIGTEGQVCTIAKWWNLGWNPAFCERSE